MRVKTQAKRDAILEIASKAFQELGYERTSMDEIAARMGGSKVTLYGYFPSKQDLFLEAARHIAVRHLGPASNELKHGVDDVPKVLRRFGEKFLAFICTPEAVGAYRMVVAQSGQSDIGLHFFELGPKRAQDAIAAFLEVEMNAGRVKKGDPLIAAMHFAALLNAETMQRVLMGATGAPTHQQVKQMVERAVAVFAAAYAA